MSMSDNTSNTSKVLKGISSQTLVTIVLGIVEIVSFSLMSRLLTKEDFGYYAAITAITAVFSTFSETGIGTSIVQQKKLSTRFVNNAFTINMLFGTFLSLLLLVLAGPLSRFVADESMRVPLMLISGTLLLHCLTSVSKSIIHRRRQFLTLGVINLISLVITTALAVWLAYLGFGYYAILAKAILGSIITFILSWILCRTKFSFALDGQTFKKIFSFSGWLMASSLFRNLSHQIDRLLMPRLLSVSALGAYNRPKDFVEQISTKLNGIFDTALFPVLSGIQDNKRAMKSSFNRSMFLMNMFAMLLTMAFMFNSGLLIRVFFGEKWMDLQSVMFVISCSLLFNINGRLADCFLRSLGMTKQQFFFRVFEFVLKTIGVLIGFKWGILGVATSVVITNVIAKLVKIIYIGGKVDTEPKRVMNNIFLSWRYAIVMLPICLVSYILLPRTLGGEIAMAVIFALTAAVIFLFMPKLVGKQYEEEVYVKVISYVKKILHK